MKLKSTKPAITQPVITQPVISKPVISKPVITNRRGFVLTSAGLLASTLATPEGGSAWAIEPVADAARSYRFQRVRNVAAAAPIFQVTPEDGFYVHTYYDVCPFSPSQRYLAATRLPYQDRIPKLGDLAEVCVIDLHRQTIRTVYRTKSWGFQTGSLAQWGASDRHLYTNDVLGQDSQQAVCVRIDLQTGETTAFSGPMYHIAPDESSVIGFPLELLDVTQRGYGVPAKDPRHPKRLPPGASKTQGLFRTDLESSRTQLLVSLADMAVRLPEPPPEEGGTFYCWHSKFNQQGTRIMQVLRCLFPSGWGARNTTVFTFKPDGSDIRYAPGTPVWGALGGHPNWHPDGVHLIRVLRVGKDKTPRLCKFRFDAEDFTVMSEKILGGGHPSFEGQGRYIVTDHFHGNAPQKVSIQLIDMQQEQVETLCTMDTLPRAEDVKYPPHRLDGHPVWSRNYHQVCFQAAPQGKRQLYVADVSGLLS